MGRIDSIGEHIISISISTMQCKHRNESSIMLAGSKPENPSSFGKVCPLVRCADLCGFPI